MNAVKPGRKIYIIFMHFMHRNLEKLGEKTLEILESKIEF